MGASYDPTGVVVLTTHERSGYFTSVLGDDIDLRFNPHRELALRNLLHNTIVAGGNLAVIDESFFMDADDMAIGLEEFFREERHPERLKLIVVCTQREEGDLFLAFLVMYCGIYNIIYGKTGVEVSLDLDRLLRRDNTRSDVLHLAEAGRWSTAKIVRERLIHGSKSMQGVEAGSREAVEAFKDVQGEYLVNVKNLDMVNVRVVVSAVLVES